MQTISKETLDEIIFSHFEYVIDQYEKNKHLIPEGNLVEISYEKLKADPYGTVQAIYSRLKLPDFEPTADNLRKQLEKEKEYRNFTYQFSDDTIKQIENRWEKYIRKWNYKSPDGLGSNVLEKIIPD